ncbi:hypothetical protein Q6262_28080, partial [Klebsiella pneumoniae]
DIGVAGDRRRGRARSRRHRVSGKAEAEIPSRQSRQGARQRLAPDSTRQAAIGRQIARPHREVRGDRDGHDSVADRPWPIVRHTYGEA